MRLSPRDIRRLASDMHRARCVICARGAWTPPTASRRAPLALHALRVHQRGRLRGAGGRVASPTVGRHPRKGGQSRAASIPLACRIDGTIDKYRLPRRIYRRRRRFLLDINLRELRAYSAAYAFALSPYTYSARTRSRRVVFVLFWFA